MRHLRLQRIRQLMRTFPTWESWHTFLDTYQEWHAFLQGLADGFCLSKPHYDLVDALLMELLEEHHYYNVGRGLGFASFIVLVTGMIVWVASSIIGALA